MKGIVDSMGLKGATVFAVLILVSTKLGTLYPYLDVVVGAVGCLLLFMYLEIYFDKLKQGLSDKLSEEIVRVKQNGIELNKELREKMDALHSDSVKAIKEAGDANCSTVQTCHNELANSIISLNSDVVQRINEEGSKILESQEKSNAQITNQMKLDNERFEEFIGSSNEKIIKGIEDIEDNIKNVVKAGNENLQKKIKDVADAQKDEFEKISSKVSAQEKNSKEINDNLSMFRNCLEENLKAVALISQTTAGNKEEILASIKNCVKLIKSKEQEQEIIEVKDENAVIINTKQAGITIHSEMHENNKLSFMAGYQNGRMIFSKTFDDDGGITSETKYDASGQVEERKTYINKNGKISVEIDKPRR
ncbi:MAG: hypothetical protein Q4D21_00325 [Phascolarctobacterium sp.]|nr:hypothetical protein [Phascolarctobacterium sp.]